MKSSLTVGGGRIRVGMMVAILLLSGCQDPPPEPPVAAPALVPPPSIALPLDDDPAEPGGKTDAWFDAYKAYMSRELKREYLATPEDERFERWSLRLLDFQLREDLLRAHPEALTDDQREAYRRLPNADACRRFVSEHTDMAPVSTATRGK